MSDLVLGQWNVICSSCKQETSNVAIRSDTGKPYKQCRPCRQKKQKEWAKNHPELVKIYSAPSRRKAVNAWRKRNLAYDAMRRRERKARQLQAMPAWVDRKAIQEIYKNCPKDYQVDHIVPLRGQNVSGLHVPWNLQYLPGTENQKKGNRYGDMG